MSVAPTPIAEAAGPAIDVQRLGKRLGGRTIVEQIHFQVPTGVVCGLLGPNGAGKTTLLRCLTGALHPDYGRCIIGGADPVSAPHAHTRFGFAPDGAPMEPQLRVREYLALHARLRGLDVRTASERVLAIVDLRHLERALIGTLSRGERTRLALAEALLHEPPVLILDEPASGLDPAQVVALRDLLHRLVPRHTILLATHHLSEAARVCQELVVLVAGRVRFQGSVDELAGSGDLEDGYLRLAGPGA